MTIQADVLLVHSEQNGASFVCSVTNNGRVLHTITVVVVKGIGKEVHIAFLLRSGKGSLRANFFVGVHYL